MGKAVEEANETTANSSYSRLQCHIGHAIIVILKPIKVDEIVPAMPLNQAFFDWEEVSLQCYVINLDRATDRHQQIEAEFKRVGVPLVRVSAIDGLTLPGGMPELSQPYLQHWRQPRRPKEIGRFLSHKECLARIASGGGPFGAVFEDDMVLSPQIGHLLQSADWIPDEVDIVKLESDGSRVFLGPLLSFPRLEPRLGKLLSVHLCAGGYIVSRNAARRFLSIMEERFIPVDTLMFHPKYNAPGDFNIYQVVPAVCVQRRLLGIHASSMAGTEHGDSVQRRGFAKHSRKFLQPAEKIARNLKGYWTNFFTDSHWVRVPFDCAVDGREN
ncbi:glycosyltransferase family 25 protein [Brucella intermedia]|uniref:glycosyltransferase family 25 protein n=1 Tax=Brucella TaxID=234 RepID=UPI0009463841|nr:glycosyltransferase family 25 protein [Brucella intermedia]